MTRNITQIETLSEEAIKEILADTRGDVIRAAHHLGCSYREMQRCIKASPTLQAFAVAIEKVKVSPEYEAMTREQFSNELEARTLSGKLIGLETIEELATMDHGESAALADVKLKAAIALRGAGQDASRDSGDAGILHELNELYRQHAPRHRAMRATLTLEVGPSNSLAGHLPSQTVPATLLESSAPRD